MRAAFFRAEFTEESKSKAEHELCWLPLHQSRTAFFHECHGWAVERAMQQFDASPKGKRFMNEPEYVDAKQLRPGPIRNKSLPSELLEQIKAVFDVIGPYINMTLEEFEIGFMRDMHPESEVSLWCSIMAAWLAYHEKYLGDEMLPDEEERKMLGALIAISTGVDDVAKLNVPQEVGRRLIQCYDNLRKE
jgi:hypothetical protein